MNKQMLLKQRHSKMSRRDAMIRGGSALAVLAFFESRLFAWGRDGETVISFKERPAEAEPGQYNMLDWEGIESWITPREKWFHVAHYGEPEVDANSWKLQIGGLVDNPGSFTLEQIKSLPKREVTFTLECSGNAGGAMAAIGNAQWGGTPLAAFLEKAGVDEDGTEIVFYGADAGEASFPYISGREVGRKIRDFTGTMNFARSLSLAEAVHPDNLLCYEMNGEPLLEGNGYPLRLICPKWYGMANVKWLTRIEVMGSRFMGPMMATMYMTIREEPDEDGGGSKWVRTSVGKSKLKSIPAKWTVKDGQHRVYGAAWGADVARVEVNIDGGPWIEATIDEGKGERWAWKFWHHDWNDLGPGEHKVTSRAIDKKGNIQPTSKDAAIKTKRTYWEANAQVTRTVTI